MSNNMHDNGTNGDGAARVGSDELDALLRVWHADSVSRVAEGRERLVAALGADMRGPGSGVSGVRGPAVAHGRQTICNLQSAICNPPAFRNRLVRYSPAIAAMLAVAVLTGILMPTHQTATYADSGNVVLAPEGGRLDALDEDGNVLGPCALKGTDVDVDISAFFSRVTVRQTYHNPFDDKVEAVYTFPLSHRAAVDRMTMTIGDRVVIGEVHERQAARAIYEAARESGHVAGLLEQERPNIFTQSVANIEPNAEVLIEISYVETLERRDGWYSFDFPMVVSPRYIPSYASGGVLPPGLTPREGLTLVAPADVQILQAGQANTPGLLSPEELSSLVHAASPIEPPDAARYSGGQPELWYQFAATYADGSKDVGTLHTDGTGQIDGRWFYVDPHRLETGATVGGEPGAPLAAGTDRVPDAARITPRPVRPPTRAGHEIAFSVSIDTGGPGIVDVGSESHELVQIDEAVRDDGLPSAVRLTLRQEREIPNRDLVFSWRQTSDTIQEALFTHTGERGNFFTLILQPPEGAGSGVRDPGSGVGSMGLWPVRSEPGTRGPGSGVRGGEHGPLARAERQSDEGQALPRELVFVLDTSGSMQGFPIEKAKEVMSKAIDAMRAGDTFNMITFSGDTHVLWETPQPGTPDNVAHAQAFLQSREGSGGTEMMKAIEAALASSQGGSEATGGEGEAPAEPDAGMPVRIVMFLTDGCVGNDMEIIEAVKRHAATTRVFSFGVGNSPNRYLLDGMARAGRGEVEYVLLESDANAAVERFTRRIESPVLADISIAFDANLSVDQLLCDTPFRVERIEERLESQKAENPDGTPDANSELSTQYSVLSTVLHPADLFDAKPIIIHGRYTSPGGGRLTIRGRTAAGPYERVIDLELPESQPEHDVIATLWARTKVESLLNEDLAAVQSGQVPDEVRQQVIDLGETFQIMTQFTSFVAVEQLRVTVGGKPRLVHIPVELPDGMSYEGAVGEGLCAWADSLSAMSQSTLHHDVQDDDVLYDDGPEAPLSRDPTGERVAGAADVNSNGQLDVCDIADGTSVDVDARAEIPDACDDVTKVEGQNIARSDPPNSLDHIVPEVRWEATTLESTIDWLRTYSGAPIEVNWQALEAAGIEKDAEVTMKLNEVPLQEVLNRLLDQTGGGETALGYAIKDGVMSISTREDLGRRMLAETYNAGDILVSVPDFDPRFDLSDFQSAGGGAGEGSGGGGLGGGGGGGDGDGYVDAPDAGIAPAEIADDVDPSAGAVQTATFSDVGEQAYDQPGGSRKIPGFADECDILGGTAADAQSVATGDQKGAWSGTSAAGNAGPADSPEAVEDENALLWQQAVSTFEDAASDTRAAIEAGNFTDARQLAQEARFAIERARRHAPTAAEYEGQEERAKELNVDLAMLATEVAETEAESRRTELIGREQERLGVDESQQAKIALLKTEAEKLRRERKYEEAIQIYKSVLAVDPTDEETAWRKTVLEDFQTSHSAYATTKQHVKQTQSTISKEKQGSVPWTSCPLYPKDWPTAASRTGESSVPWHQDLLHPRSGREIAAKRELKEEPQPAQAAGTNREGQAVYWFYRQQNPALPQSSELSKLTAPRAFATSTPGEQATDSVEDFLIAGQFASPRNRALAGGAYLVRGRRKLPFPDDAASASSPADASSHLPVQFVQPDATGGMVLDHDFKKSVNLSYGYMFQHDPATGPASRQFPLTTEGTDPAFPIAADANPYVAGVEVLLAGKTVAASPSEAAEFETVSSSGLNINGTADASANANGSGASRGQSSNNTNHEGETTVVVDGQNVEIDGQPGDAFIFRLYDDQSRGGRELNESASGPSPIATMPLQNMHAEELQAALEPFLEKAANDATPATQLSFGRPRWDYTLDEPADGTSAGTQSAHVQAESTGGLVGTGCGGGAATQPYAYWEAAQTPPLGDTRLDSDRNRVADSISAIHICARLEDIAAIEDRLREISSRAPGQSPEASHETSGPRSTRSLADENVLMYEALLNQFETEMSNWGHHLEILGVFGAEGSCEEEIENAKASLAKAQQIHSDLIAAYESALARQRELHAMLQEHRDKQRESRSREQVTDSEAQRAGAVQADQPTMFLWPEQVVLQAILLAIDGQESAALRIAHHLLAARPDFTLAADLRDVLANSVVLESHRRTMLVELRDRAVKAVEGLAERLRLLARRLDERLLALAMGERPDSPPAGVHITANGVLVSVLLEKQDNAAVDRLRRAGLVVEDTVESMPVVIGAAPLDRLADIALVEGVRRVVPTDPKAEGRRVARGDQRRAR